MVMSKIYSSQDIAIHGTYPHDSGRWKSVRKIDLGEVISFVKRHLGDDHIPAEWIAHCKARSDSKSRWPDIYLWLNKGYIVLDAAFKTQAAKPTLGLALAEQTTEGEVSNVPRLKPGMQAVYLHDGNYYLIEYNEPGVN